LPVISPPDYSNAAQTAKQFSPKKVNIFDTRMLSSLAVHAGAVGRKILTTDHTDDTHEDKGGRRELMCIAAVTFTPRGGLTGTVRHP
jgi:hypothetical protein